MVPPTDPSATAQVTGMAGATVKVRIPATPKYVAAGLIVIPWTACTATVADALLVVSATLVAITWIGPGCVAGVKNPAAESVPPLTLSRALQVTEVSFVPTTIAWNCWDAPTTTVADTGDMNISTADSGRAGLLLPSDAPAPAPPPHPPRNARKALPRTAKALQADAGPFIMPLWPNIQLGLAD